MAPPSRLRPLLLLRALSLAAFLQVDLAKAMSKERWQDTSQHRYANHFVTDNDPTGDEWYPGDIVPSAKAPWYKLRTDCVLVPEEERLHSSTRDRMWYEDREIEPQLDPHLERDSTGFGLHSWRELERPLWRTAASERFQDTSQLQPAVGDSIYGEDMSQERHSVEGASPDWLAIVDSDANYEFSDNISYHSFYHNPKNYEYAIPHTWYHSTPNGHNPVSHSDKLLHDFPPSGITKQSELHQKLNGRKQWKTLGCISGSCGKHSQYHYSSDEQVFEQEEDQRSWEETVGEPEYSEWTYGRPSHALAWSDRNHYLHEGCSCIHKHGFRYHGAGESVYTGLKTEVEEPIEAPWKLEATPEREEEDSESLVLATVPLQFYGKHKPEYDQHSTEQDDSPDNIQHHKILVHSEEITAEADELLQNAETEPDDVPDGEKFYSGPDSVKQKPEYGQHITEQEDAPNDVQDHKFLVHYEDFLVGADELPENTETVPDGVLDGEKLNSGSLDNVGERQCQKEDDEFGHYVIRCNEESGDTKVHEDPIHTDNVSATTDVTVVQVEEHEASEPHEHASLADDESVGNHKWKYDVLEPRGCSKTLDESDKISSEKIETPPTSEITPEDSKWDTKLTDDAISIVEEFYGKQKTLSEEPINKRGDEPATLQADKDVNHSDDSVSEIPYIMKALYEPGKWKSGPQDHIGDRIPVSYGQHHSLFGHLETSIKDSSDNINIYGDSLNADNFQGKENAAPWQTKVDPVEGKWKPEPFDQVSIFTDESYGNKKLEQYATAWKDVLDELKTRKAMVQSENFPGQIVGGAWKTEHVARKEEWETDFLDQVDIYVDDSYYKPNPGWEYYSKARNAELGFSDSVYPTLLQGFADKEDKKIWTSEKISEKETAESEPWERHNIMYDSIKTGSHSVLVDGSDAETLDLEWGSGVESEYESFPGVNFQSDEAHGHQTTRPEHYGSGWIAPFDAAENQDSIDSETFSAEVDYFRRSHKVVHEDEMNRYGTSGHAGEAPDGPFRIQRPLEWYKPVDWRTVSGGTTYQARGVDKLQWDENVQRGVLAEDEAVVSAAATDRVIYDAGSVSRGECNFGTHQLPQKEYISYESEDAEPTVGFKGVIKSKFRTAPRRSKVHGYKASKKWREDVEGVALPFEWPTKNVIAREDDHPKAERNYYTGRELRGAEDVTREADERSWTVESGRGTSEEWSSEGGDWSDWSSEAEEGSGGRDPAAAPPPNMIGRLVRVFTGPIKQAACYARRSWKERKAARSRSRADAAGFEPRTAVSPASPPRPRAGGHGRPLEARKRGRARLRELLGRLLEGACGGGAGHTTVHLTMPQG